MEVASINISKRKGERKVPVEKCRVIENFGLDGDAHSGKWHRQVSLLSIESIEKVKSEGLNICPGDFAENITTKGIKIDKIKVGTQIQIGKDVLLEVTQIGKECHDKCEIYKRVGNCVMPQEGIFAKVLKGGIIMSGDKIKINYLEK
ncbi:MAG TPA: MOSC domain-containing protein [Candidatus Altiarchaeales archaeon]|nr:MOSC domain-containing protein [Candidatus Altiarchaeales archaeon]